MKRVLVYLVLTVAIVLSAINIVETWNAPAVPTSIDAIFK